MLTSMSLSSYINSNLPLFKLWNHGRCLQNKTHRVQTKQNQCIRCMFFAHKRENANIYYALLKILELNNIFKMKIALFAHEIQNDKNSIPAVFSDALTLA